MSCYEIRRFVGRTLVVAAVIVVSTACEFVAIVAAARYLQ